MEGSIALTEAIIFRWDANAKANTFTKVTSLFHAGRAEAQEFLQAIAYLQRAMIFFVSGDCAAHSGAFSDDTKASDDDEIHASGESIEQASDIAMANLCAIAEAMITTGYGKECIRVYKTLRKSIVDEGLYRLGFKRLSQSRIQKLDWEVLDLKICSWLGVAAVAAKTIFSGERILCDHVFASSDSIRESCFADITREAATLFLGFSELVAKMKRSPEKLFRILDLYDAISDLRSKIETVFSFESTAVVLSQTLASILKLAEAARATLADFEATIQKDASKSPVPGGGVHPLNYPVFLAEHEAALADIYADFPLQVPTPLPESFFNSASDPASPFSGSDGGAAASLISLWFAWIILVLLCKLDGKAEVYWEVALSYLFLANNLQYIVNKVRETRLRFLLGEV